MVLQVGKPAPTFNKTAVIDGIFEEVSLDQYKGKWVVLAFVPMAFTFVCPTEIIAYDKQLDEFRKRGAEVFYASTDSEFSLLAWNNLKSSEGGLGGVKMGLIADPNHTLSRDYDVLVEEEGVALRGIFIIDPDGVVQQATVNNSSVGRNPEETIRLLDAFKFTRENGEVCPAGWKPGDETINTNDASKYFSKH